MKNTRTLIIPLKKIILCVLICSFFISVFISGIYFVKVNPISGFLIQKSLDGNLLEKELPVLMVPKVQNTKISRNELISFLINEDITKPVNILGQHILFISGIKDKLKELYGYADESNNYYIPKIIEKYLKREDDNRKKYNPATEKTVKSIKNDSTEVGKFGISFDNKTKYSIDVNSYYSMPLKLDKKSVLIVHTHGSEGYNPTDRNENLNENVVRVGREMKSIFESNGITVYHSEKMHDIPKFNNSYGNSLATVKAMLEKHPDIGIVLDIHRDAMISASGEVYKLVCDNKGEKTAQVMFVVGTDEGGLKHAGWKNNLNFAVKCQKRANELFPNIVRPINLRTERFNQHTTGASIIVEVGTNGNTLEEAISSAKITAQAISDVIKTY